MTMLRQALAPALLLAMLGSGAAEEKYLRLEDVAGVYRSPVAVRRPGETVRTENILEIVPYGEARAYLRTRLNHPVTGNLCSLWGIAEIQGSRLVYRSAGDEGEAPSPCSLTVRFEKGQILFDDRDRQCERRLCGANAHFSQFVFKESARRPITYLERIRASRQYREAVAEYERRKDEADTGSIEYLVGIYRVPVEAPMPGSERPFRTENVLEIVPYREKSFYITAEINGYHACHLTGIAEVEGSRLVYRSVPEEGDPTPACHFSLKVVGQEIALDDQGGYCARAFCGAHADFDNATFKTGMRQRIDNPSEILASGGYDEATSEYERLLQSRTKSRIHPERP
ncbi:hypothetical protein [Microvirga roseola]|uniref:hypothetical protein n=1 Tax=Microvirga roseola TaxID=2883126 RepID=UPI001E3321B4|nr:hypothetical protein [Microvirga roseola]